MPRTRTRSPKPGLYQGVPMAEYLAMDAWSKSDVAAMLAGAEACHYKRTGGDDKQTEEATFGTLAHTALLEPAKWPPRDVVWVDGDWRSNPARAEVADARQRGYTVAKPDVRDRVEACIARCLEHPEWRKLLLHSDLQREVVAIARCPQTGLLLKARADLLCPTLGIVGDLKTTSTGSDNEDFAKTSRKFHYWLGASHYLEVFRLASGLAYDLFMFLAVEQEPPFFPRAFVPPERLVALGDRVNVHLRRKVAECIKAGTWPAANNRIESVDQPEWFYSAMARMLEEQTA